MEIVYEARKPEGAAILVERGPHDYVTIIELVL